MTRLYDVTIRMRIAAPKNEAAAVMTVPMRVFMDGVREGQVELGAGFKPGWTPPTLLEYRIVDAEAK